MAQQKLQSAIACRLEEHLGMLIQQTDQNREENIFQIKKKDFGKKDEEGSRERNDKERRDPDKYHHDVYFTFNIKR